MLYTLHKNYDKEGLFMELKKLTYIKALLSHLSALPLHIIESTDAELVCMDNGLRRHFNTGEKLYDDLRKLLARELCPDTILYLQDTFCLHYVIFLVRPDSSVFCSLGPFSANTDKNSSFHQFLQQTVDLPAISAESAIGAARSILALTGRPSPAPVREMLLQGDPSLLVRLSAELRLDADPVIQRLIYYIQTHLHQKLTLQGLSEYLGFSPTYISHRFKEQVGMPPMQYILQQRLLHSQYLLRTTNAPIREIAESVGITDCSYFTKLFREYSGSTPSDYRNAYPLAGGILIE